MHPIHNAVEPFNASVNNTKTKTEAVSENFHRKFEFETYLQYLMQSFRDVAQTENSNIHALAGIGSNAIR